MLKFLTSSLVVVALTFTTAAAQDPETRSENEEGAFRVLRAIQMAQSRFLEVNKGTTYAKDLGALVQAGFLHKKLTNGVFRGYRFRVSRDSEAPEYKWIAVASPVTPGVTGNRHFTTNHEGPVYHSLRPFRLTPNCEIDSKAVRFDHPLPGWKPLDGFTGAVLLLAQAYAEGRLEERAGFRFLLQRGKVLMAYHLDLRQGGAVFKHTTVAKGNTA